MVEHLTVNIDIPGLITLCSIVMGHFGPISRMLSFLLFRHCFQLWDSCKVAWLWCNVRIEGQVDWLRLEFTIVDTMSWLISHTLSQIYIVTSHGRILWIEAIVLLSFAWGADDAWKERTLHSAARFVSLLIPWRPTLVVKIANVLAGRDWCNHPLFIGYILREQWLFSLGVLFAAHRGFSPHCSNLFELSKLVWFSVDAFAHFDKFEEQLCIFTDFKSWEGFTVQQYV